LAGIRRVKGSTFVVSGSPNTVIVVRDSVGVVVDPGIGTGRASDIVAALRGLGVGDLAYVFLTHGHTDHVAAVPGVVKAYSDVRVVSSRHCSILVEDTVSRRVLVYGGLVSEKLASMPMVSVSVDVFARPGESFFDGLRVVGLNGHTPGHVGLVVEDDWVVVAGDAILGEKVLEKFGVPFAIDLRAWLSSLETLKEYAEQGYTIVPGHGPIAREKRAVQLVEANLKAGMRVYEFVLSKIRDEEALTLDKLAYLATVELGSAEPSPRQLLLNKTALASVLAWLEDDGLVEPIVTSEGVAWKARK
jgi:glyoxylase-like metal-dependent hydrolase (beta-lactamase superfamily II)